MLKQLSDQDFELSKLIGAALAMLSAFSTLYWADVVIVKDETLESSEGIFFTRPYWGEEVQEHSLNIIERTQYVKRINKITHRDYFEPVEFDGEKLISLRGPMRWLALLKLLLLRVSFYEKLHK